MIVTPVKTDIITPRGCTLIELLDKHITMLPEKSVLVITSKVVSLCEGSVAPISTDRTELIKQQAQAYLEPGESAYNKFFTITNHTLISNAGIDESNADGMHVLWPHNPMKTADEIQVHFTEKLGVKHLGVIISDSTSRPFRVGATGITLGFSGFVPFREYSGTADLFGRSFVHDTADIAGGLAAAAVLTMGEGSEQTPLAIITDIPFVDFVDRAPNEREQATLKLTLKNDFYETFFRDKPWKSNH